MLGQLVSLSTIIAMFASLALVVVVPILIIVFFARRFTMNLSAIVLGFLMFIAFDTIFLSFFDAFILGQASSAVKDLIESTTVGYTFYYAFIHALLYTGGFSVALRMASNSDTGIGTGIAVGLGCGTASAFLSTGYPMINNIIAAFQINKSGVDGFLSGVPEESLQPLVDAADALIEATPAIVLFPAFERLMLFAVLVSIGVIIHLAITHRSHIAFQYAAMFLLFLTFIPPALYIGGLLHSVPLLETMLVLTAALAVITAYFMGKRFGNNPVRY